MARPAHDYARVDKHVPVTRRAETTNPYSPVTILIALVATLGILLYAQFLLNPANRGDFLPYALVIIAETILITHALLAMWTILSGAKSPRDFAFYEAQNAMFDKKAIKAAGLKEQPHSVADHASTGKEITVDVFITVYGEDSTRSARTAAAAMAIKGKHRTWILDDGRSDEVKALAAELGCHYVRRLQQQRRQGRQHQPRAVHRQGRVLRVFDADFVPEPDFLVETVPFFVNEQRRLRPDAAGLRQPAST